MKPCRNLGWVGLLSSHELLIINTSIEEFCQINGLRVVVFKQQNYFDIKETINKILPKDKPWYDELWEHKDDLSFLNLFGKTGKPDYFMWNESETSFWFVEYKSLNDSIRPSQLQYFARNNHLPMVLIHSLKRSKKQ